MEPWVPPRLPHPRGRHAAWAEGYDRGPWREASHGPPPPHSRHNSEWMYHHEPQAGPQPWPEPGAECYHPTYHPRLQDYRRPNSRAGYYESDYPNWSYSRQGREDAYRSSVDDSAYGGYQRSPQVQQNERDPRQRDTWGECANSWDQRHYRAYRHEDGSGFVGHNNVTPIRSKTHESYEDNYGSNKDGSYEANYRSPLQQGWIQDEFQGNFLENASVPAHELPLPEEPSLLQQYKDSGLSSSSYELSQYMYDSSNHDEAAPSTDRSPIQAAEDTLAASPHPVAPQKFPLPHVPVCFGAGGQLVRGCPHYPAEGQPALIEIHSLEVILHDTAEQEAMRVFPGPLIREDLHKVDVMTFCQRRAAAGCDPASSRGRDSALLWKLLLLLCRQNGSMVGSDIAELLMQERKHRERYKRQETRANLINLTGEEWPTEGCGTTDLLTGEIVPSAGTAEQRVEKFTKLLFYGRKKEALDWAMRNQLWGHALFLSSKMDQRTYSWVLSGFTSTLATNDPLQTLFQIMSGRIPQASLCCGDEKWGDWKPHLAVILSNQVGDTVLNPKAIVTMGDTLAGKELREAAHFCYLMANVPFGHYGVKADRMVLLGSSQSQAFAQFARTECIHRTEIFEYCQLLGCRQAFIPSFQVYKLIYASRLLDYGLAAQALHYCEAAGMALLAQKQNTYPVLLEQVIKLAERLKLSDPRLLERPEQEESLEPDWLMELRTQRWQWEEEGGLPSATSRQPEIPRVSGSIAGLAPHFEFAQSQRCTEDLEQHPSSHQLPVDSTQYQPGVDQRLHSYPGYGHPSDADVVTCLPGSGQVSISSPNELPDDLASNLYQSLGDVVETCEPYPIPDNQKNVLEHQNTSNTRNRTVSESSTISMVEDIPEFPDDTGVEAPLENPPAENAGQEHSKASGFGWLSWFRSKPNKDVEPSKKVPAAPLDFPAPVSQEKAAPPPFLPPLGETRPSSLHPPPLPPLPHTDANPFSESSLGTKSLPGHSSRERVMFHDAGDQASFSNRHCSPDHVPPPPRGGVPLFNPAQVATLAVSGAGYPRRILQRHYPHHPQ